MNARAAGSPSDAGRSRAAVLARCRGVRRAAAPPFAARRVPFRLALPLAVVLGAGGVACPAASLAEDAPQGEEPGLIGTVGGFVDDTQRRASERLIGFVSSVDGFFGDGTASSTGNRSWARIRVEASQPGDEDLSFDATVKLRIVLPQAERRFRLLLSSEDEEQGSVISGDDAVTPQRVDTGGGQDVSLALRFIRTARETSSLNFDLGVRQRDGAVQVFGRINATAEGEMVRHWTGRVSNNYYYYSKSGYENRLRFNVYRPLARRGDVFFQTSTAFDWRKGRKGATIGETLGLYAELDERRAIALEALASYSTALNGAQSARYGGAAVRLRWRHSVWREWFFYEVWPSVAWPSSNDYERVWGGLVRIEVILGQRS